MHPSRVVLGAFLIVLGIGWILQAAGIMYFNADVIGPLALIGIGIALLVGAPRGLHVPLFIGGIVLTAILAGNNGAMRPPDHGVTSEQPATANEIHPYRVGAGTLTIDLTALPLDGETYHVSARAGTGRIDMVVPSGTAVVAHARSSVGSIDVFGRRSNGLGNRTTINFDYPGRTKFVLDLRVGAGTINVRHEPHA